MATKKRFPEGIFKKRFPEGIMTEQDWVFHYAESVERYTESWYSYFNRTKFNRMDGPQQKAYEKALRERADKPHFRAWRKGHESFLEISESTFDAAKCKGIPLDR